MNEMLKKLAKDLITGYINEMGKWLKKYLKGITNEPKNHHERR
jgi:hypothetical protein